MSATADYLNRHPQEFVGFLRDQGIHRFHFVRGETSGLKASHDVLQPIADFLAEDRRDFRKHEGLFFQVSRKHDTLQGAFVHRTCRGQAAGGVRFWRYRNLEEYLRDGLRLAIGMTHKNALAGLWWGGGKGVMSRNPDVNHEDPEVRATLYEEYGELMTALRGCYVTAEDVGTAVSDMAHVFKKTRFTTCIPPDLGGSGNPSVPTARGVIAGMEAALEFLEMPGLKDKRIAVQGMGHVGAPLVRFLHEKGVARVFGCDILLDNVEQMQSEFGTDTLESRVVEPGDDWIYGVDADIFAPCATGAILNPDTIPKIKPLIVCGAANNQLEDMERDDRLLFDRQVLYVPDFLTNRMGIVNCCDEAAGSIPEDSKIERHLSKEWEFSIHRMALKVLEVSKGSKEPPGAVALKMAEELSMEPNPVFGHRGIQIIRSLAKERWFEEG